MTRCGMVAIVGSPNVGKSTLLNAMVGARVGITSPKANTTRVVVRGVLARGEAQVVLVDTPGLNESTKAFDRALVQEARGALAEADMVMLVIDAQRGLDGKATEVIEGLKKSGQAAVLVLNKIDKVKKKADLLPLMIAAQDAGVFAEVIPVAALKEDGVEALVTVLAKLMPEGEWLFPADMVTDMPMGQRLAELTREQVMRRIHEEIPYGVTVETEAIEEAEDGVLEVSQRIVVSKEGHKGILVGKGGATLKELGTLARFAMKEALGRPLRLHLVVRVK